MFGILRWHFWDAPVWLIQLAWNMQRVLARFFSAPLLFKTLLAHWHKDAVGYDKGGISAIALAFAWNMISRVLGFIVRSVTLMTYVTLAVIVLTVSVGVVVVFLTWPFVSAVGVAVSLGANL